MRTRAKAALLFASTLLSVPAVLVGLAAPASAAPADCTNSFARSYTTSGDLRTAATWTCTSGTGQYRGYLNCVSTSRGIPVLTTKYGAWATAGPGTSSTAVCVGGPRGGGVQFA